MNLLMEKGLISEMSCGSNFAYILQDNNAFLSTEYKVLQSQSNSCFVKCMKNLYNGKIQLYYLTNAYKPLATMLGNLEPDNFMIIVANLLSDIIDVKSNGFLSCQNIDISLEKIYVDPTTFKVSLVYLPLSERIFDDYSIFENELRTGLVKLISSISTLSSAKTIQFSTDLSNGTLRLEDLYNRIKSGSGRSVKTPPGNQGGDNQQGPNGGSDIGRIRIIAMNAPTRVEIDVTKDEFVIGKNASVVDGVVSFNKMISRVHCKINKRGGQITITDLQSANGTYVNRVRLQPNQPNPIKNGDIIRLANSDFQVSIG